jgi:uncharacterized damage-inducible protein DinB
MPRVDEFKELYAFNRWANLRVLEATGALSDEQFVRELGSSFPSVRDTLVHIMSGEWVWLSRWKGFSPRTFPVQWKPLMLYDLKQEWTVVDTELQLFVRSLHDADLEQSFTYRNFAGDQFTTPLPQMLRHLVNHGSYHRGQITTMLRQLGAAAPATDLIAWYRLQTPVIAQ